MILDLPGTPFVPPRPRIPLVTSAIVTGAPLLERDLLQLRSVEEVARWCNGRLAPDDEDAEGIFMACLSHWHWMRGGRRLVVLDPGTVTRLLDASLPEAVPVVDRGFALQWTARPDLKQRMAGEHLYVCGGYVCPPSPGSRKAGQIAMFDPLMLGDDGEWRGMTPVGIVPDDKAALWGNLVARAIAALSDRRVSQVVAHPKTSTALHRAAKRGVVVQRLELTPDGTGVWVTRKIGPPSPPPVQPEVRAEPAAHVVHEHTALYWVSRATHPDVVPELDPDGHPLVRAGAKGVPLVAVRLPRREHVRGKGEASVRVVRVVPPR